jgi:hypothetical protein
MEQFCEFSKVGKREQHRATHEVEQGSVKSINALTTGANQKVTVP